MNPVLLSVFIASATITAYRSVPEQTDASPFITATGERVCSDGVAVSQDLLVQNGGPIAYGDWVYIDGIGIKRVNDTMNRRHRLWFDLWVKTKEEESRIWRKFRNKKVPIWVIKEKRQIH